MDATGSWRGRTSKLFRSWNSPHSRTPNAGTTRRPTARRLRTASGVRTTARSSWRVMLSKAEPLPSHRETPLDEHADKLPAGLAPRTHGDDLRFRHGTGRRHAGAPNRYRQRGSQASVRHDGPLQPGIARTRLLPKHFR